MTALAETLARRIRQEGPISVADYMQAAAAHYYQNRDPFGAKGDFITAPEVSQMFGELIGLWCVDTWRAMGAPAPFVLAELGPGRGTLMRDALRAARLAPDFLAVAALHLVETSAVLRERQAETLADHRPFWHARIEDLPDRPMLLIANEFFDVLPVRQFVSSDEGWHERRVTLHDNGFAFVADPPPFDMPWPAAAAGAIREISPEALAYATWVGRRVAQQGGAALLIDYGPAQSGAGDTLQALKEHRRHDVLRDPGTADVTAHVDFAALAQAASGAGARVHGPVEQGAFLHALGIEKRAARLMEASPAQAATVAAGLRRLTDPDAMGSLFKTLAIVDPVLPAPAGIRMIALDALTAPGVAHGFFTRDGGVSGGIYASLNCGGGSGDDPAAVAENRGRAATTLGVARDALATNHQVHGSDIVTVTADWRAHPRARADGLVTKARGIALGILTADCVPVLFADAEAGVVGAAHAGWRGAVGGVLDATVRAMAALGAEPSRIRAGFGPAIAQASYEVGPEFPAPFLAENPGNERFFVATPNGKYRFDLPGYVRARLERIGLAAVAATGGDTAAEPERFFSYRRSRLRGEPDYGRLLSAIALL